MSKPERFLSIFLQKQRFLPIFLLTIFFDQTSKFLVTLFGVAVSYNSGISFTVFNQGNSQFLTVLLGMLIYFLYMSFKEYWQENSLATGLFFGGAIANLFDRLLFGAVRDWLYIPFTQIQNNLADWAIFVGLVLLFWNFTRVN